MRTQSVMTTGLWLALSFFVVACSGKNIIDLNNQLIETQQQKTLIERQGGSSPDEMAVKLSQVSDQFAKIGDEAYAEATRSSDVRAKIANYRIAATAYWQRGSESALAVAQEGAQLCNTGDGFKLSPRDCAIIVVIPSFVMNDLWIRKLKSKDGGLDRNSPDFVSRGREAIVALVQAYNGLSNASTRIASSDVSVEMLQAVSRQQQRIKTSIDDLLLFIFTRANASDRPAAREICSYIRGEAPSIVPARCTS